MSTQPLTLYQVRPFSMEKDAELVSSWWSRHGCGDFPFAMLPPDGFMMCADGVPVCAAWVYLSCGVGVAFVEWCVSAPGRSMSESRESFTKLVDFIRGYLSESGYGAMWANTLPGIARVLKGCGFESCGERVAMICRTEKEEDYGS